MNLSPRSRRLALFDSPVEVTRSYTVEKRGKQTEFRQFSVPPFDYEVSFREAPGNSYVVSFALTEIHAEGPELAAILSRLMGRDVPVAKAELWKRQFNPVGILNTGNASQVLGSVVRIIRDFVREKNPSCLALNAMEPSRKDLYRRMVRSIARGARVDETQYGFQICLPTEEPKKKMAMRLTRKYSSVRVATNYGVTKEFARNLIYFFNQVQSLARRAETDTRRYMNEVRPEDKD